MAKKLVSFLGISDYKKTEYSFADEKISCKFIQTAIYKIVCKDFSGDDSIVIFATDEANEKHFCDLKNELQSLQCESEIVCKKIDASKTESDVWNLFDAIFDELKTDDEIIFDITHSFRYLPMICFSLLYYAETIKKITIDGIFYGAWEARNENNVTPIFDLTNAYEILQWTEAASAFVHYGHGDKMYQLVQKTAKDFHGTKKLANDIEAVSNAINCNRGNEIYQGKIFSKIQNDIAELKNTKMQKPLEAFSNIVNKRMENFSENNMYNFIPAVEWCIQSGKIVQGITFLQEGLVSFVLEKNKFDIHERDLRIALSSRFQKKSIEKNQEKKWNEIKETEKYKTELETIISNDEQFFENIGDLYSKIAQVRNDVNHGGVNEGSRNAQSIIAKLKNYFEETKTLLENYDGKKK